MAERKPKVTVEKPKVTLDEVTDPKELEEVKASKRGGNGRASEIKELLDSIQQAGKVGAAYRTSHNPGAISRVITKNNLKGTLQVRQRTIGGKKRTYILKLK